MSHTSSTNAFSTPSLLLPPPTGTGAKAEMTSLRQHIEAIFNTWIEPKPCKSLLVALERVLYSSQRYEPTFKMRDSFSFAFLDTTPLRRPLHSTRATPHIINFTLLALSPQITAAPAPVINTSHIAFTVPTYKAASAMALQVSCIWLK